MITQASLGTPRKGGARSDRRYFFTSADRAHRQAASWPSHGHRGSVAARGTLAPTTGAPCCVGCSIAGAGHRVPRGEGQGCLGPPHSGIREWLNYSGSVAAGKHMSRWVGWRPGREG